MTEPETQPEPEIAAWHWPMGPSLSHGTVTSSILLTGRLLVVLVA